MAQGNRSSRKSPRKSKKNMKVECFNEMEIRKELKECSKELRDYVKAQIDNGKRWEYLANEAISKLKSKSK